MSEDNSTKISGIDITGHTYGHLLVLTYQGKCNKWGQQVWQCRCACGKILDVLKYSLRSGNTTSCGCYKINLLKSNTTTHGQTKGARGTHNYSPEYRAWDAMVQRCTNPNCSYWPIYGGRGIRICRRWIKSFEKFFADMGQKPSKQHSLDRINNDGDYTPKNCRWATRREQNRNKRTNVWLTFQGEKRCMRDWSILTGIGDCVIRYRLRKGWSDEKTLTTPVKTTKSRKENS